MGGLFGKQKQPCHSPPRVFRARRPLDDLPRIWLRRTMDAFDQLIHLGERQPSNGTLRKVYPPDGETYFAVAYGKAPDDDLRDLLVCCPIWLVLFGVLGLTLASEEYLRQVWHGHIGT